MNLANIKVYLEFVDWFFFFFYKNTWIGKTGTLPKICWARNQDPFLTPQCLSAFIPHLSLPNSYGLNFLNISQIHSLLSVPTIITLVQANAIYYYIYWMQSFLHIWCYSSLPSILHSARRILILQDKEKEKKNREITEIVFETASIWNSGWKMCWRKSCICIEEKQIITLLLED